MSVSRFDEARRERLLGMVEAGRSVEQACAAVGVSRQTVFRWQARGEVEVETPAAEFAKRLATARGDSDESDVPDEAETLRLLGRAARKGSVTALKALLAHHKERREAAGGRTNAFEALAGDELSKRRRPA